MIYRGTTLWVQHGAYVVAVDLFLRSQYMTTSTRYRPSITSHVHLFSTDSQQSYIGLSGCLGTTFSEFPTKLKLGGLYLQYIQDIQCIQILPYNRINPDKFQDSEAPGYLRSEHIC